mmetsp:Transcript_33366/g.54132  ORF Transcript_33366/g.54132 Transcript_33366/m.54132 type:complete len:854 (+) Transcript_33366:256-2817(+)
MGCGVSRSAKAYKLGASTPGRSPSEDVNLPYEQMFLLLNHPNRQDRLRALNALVTFSSAMENVKTMADNMGENDLEPLIKCTASRRQEERVLALVALRNLSRNEKIAIKLVRQYSLKELRKFCEGESDVDEEQMAYNILTNMTRTDEGRLRIVNEGLLAAIVEDINNPFKQNQYRLPPALVLCNVAQCKVNFIPIAEARGIEALVSLCAHPFNDLQFAGINGIVKLAEDQLFRQQLIMKGCIQPLIKLLKSDNIPIRAVACDDIGNIAQDEMSHGEIASNGGISLLVDLVRSSKHELEHGAVLALAALARNPTYRQQVVEAQGLFALLPFVNATEGMVDKALQEAASSAVYTDSTLKNQNTAIQNWRKKTGHEDIEPGQTDWKALNPRQRWRRCFMLYKRLKVAKEQNGFMMSNPQSSSADVVMPVMGNPSATSEVLISSLASTPNSLVGMEPITAPTELALGASTWRSQRSHTSNHSRPMRRNQSTRSMMSEAYPDDEPLMSYLTQQSASSLPNNNNNSQNIHHIHHHYQHRGDPQQQPAQHYHSDLQQRSNANARSHHHRSPGRRDTSVNSHLSDISVPLYSSDTDLREEARRRQSLMSNGDQLSPSSPSSPSRSLARAMAHRRSSMHPEDDPYMDSPTYTPVVPHMHGYDESGGYPSPSSRHLYHIPSDSPLSDKRRHSIPSNTNPGLVRGDERHPAPYSQSRNQSLAPHTTRSQVPSPMSMSGDVLRTPHSSRPVAWGSGSPPDSASSHSPHHHSPYMQQQQQPSPHIQHTQPSPHPSPSNARYRRYSLVQGQDANVGSRVALAPASPARTMVPHTPPVDKTRTGANRYAVMPPPIPSSSLWPSTAVAS